MILPKPLAPMALFNQFVLYKLVRKPDKTLKIPINPKTFLAFEKGSDWQSKPDMWSSYADAEKSLKLLNSADYGIGFLFTDADPYFFIDMDNCKTPDGWSTSVHTVLNQLPGAAVEISQSGEGIHIFGAYTSIPEHSIKNDMLGADLYTRKRFVALTGNGATGSVSTNLTTQLSTIAATYFAPRATADTPVEWTTEPVSEYTGPENDDELIEKACAVQQSGVSMLSGTCSFKELWTADEDALSRSYPDDHGTRSYDPSRAEAALAQHLAFWTGKNCERMSELMNKSGLIREKWDREDYLPRTILKAVSMQQTVYSVPAATPGSDSGLKGTAKQVEYAAGIRAQKLAEATPETARKLSEKYGPLLQAKFWIENKNDTPDELAAKAVPVSEAHNPFEKIQEPYVTAGYQFLGTEQQLEFFKGCVYIQDAHRVFVPSGVLLKSEQFNATYGGYIFALDDTGTKTTRKAFEAFTESQTIRYPKAESKCFRPTLTPGSIVEQDGRSLVNVYVPVTTPRVQGDVTPFLVHLQKLLPNDNDRLIMLSYMAACVQYKGVKFQWAPLIQGTPGNGKTLITRCVMAAIGEKYSHMPPAGEIGEKFNLWLFNKLFIGVEDVYIPRHKREILETLKPMITGDRLACRAMQQDQVMGDLCCNFILNANFKAAIQKTKDDRRFCVFFTAQQSVDDIRKDGLGGNYFPDLYGWLKTGGYAAVTEYLHTYSIPDQYNPARACHRAPETSTTFEAIAAGLGGAEQEILEAVEEGRPGFRGGWISSMMLDMLLKNKRMDGKIPINRRREMLNELGYDWHPALVSGRVNNVVTPDNGKPRLFVQHTNVELQKITSAADAARAYQDAQNAPLM